MTRAAPAAAAATAPETPRQVGRLRVLLNRHGGTIAGMGEAVVRERLAAAFAQAGVDAEILLLEGQALREAAAHAVADAGRHLIDGVCVGGGDGSINTVAGQLAGTDVPLGVLPLGTHNHFAKDLGMPLDLERAVAAICASPPRAVDVGEVNGRVFVNNSLLGVYPYMVADRERRRRLHGMAKWLAMTLAFLRMLGRFPRRRLTLCVDGQARRYRTPCLFIGVNEYEVELLKVRRRCGMDGGRLWLFVAKHNSALGFAWFAFRSAFLGLSEADDFERLKATEVEVRLSASRAPVAADGEVERMRGPLRYRIRPRDLRVLAPVPS